MRGAGLGVELAAALVGFTLLGLWIDRTFATAPWALVICLAVGTIGGFYNFLRSSLRELKTPPRALRPRADETEDESAPGPRG